MPKASYGTSLYADVRIDKAAGIIRGVSVFQTGEIADRGLHADGATLAKLKGYCDAYANGVKVKADHGSGIFDVAGVLRGFRIDGDTLRADLHLLQTEENAGKLMEMAQEIPDTFGLSVSIEQELEQVGGKMFIRPTGVFSVDLVTEPAACPTGLFSTRRVDAKTKDKSMNPEELLKQVNALSERLTAFESRVANFEKQATDAGKNDVAAKLATFETELKAVRADITSNGAELVKQVSAEFSKVIGNVTVKANPADKTEKSEEKKVAPEAAFIATVQAEFAKNGGSKTKAMAAAIKADGAGYTAFISSGKAINYAVAK